MAQASLRMENQDKTFQRSERIWWAVDVKMWSQAHPLLLNEVSVNLPLPGIFHCINGSKCIQPTLE